jgi:isoleucyl-tRNA synthetase
MAITTFLDNITVLTNQSIALAQEESWDALIQNENERRTMVAEMEPVLDELDSLPDDARAQLEELIRLNERLSEICVSRRSELAANIKQVATGRQASKAYTE